MPPPRDRDTAILSALRRPLTAGVSRYSARAAAVAVLTSAGEQVTVVARPGETPTFGPHAPFLVYSITKSFAATVALRLCASGEMSLDLPVVRWLPSAPHANRITLRQLLQHTSGLPEYGELPEYHAAVRHGGEPWSEAEFYDRTGADQLRFEPGEGWAYSNVGYLVVRRLIEIVRGESFAAAVHAEVVEALGLERTWVATDADLSRLTFGPSAYLGGDGLAVHVAAHYRLGWIATGVVASTAAEVARFYRALFANDLLPPAWLQEMRVIRLLDPIPSRPFVRPGYGLGVQVDWEAPCGRVWGHTGGGPGSSASACHLEHEHSPATVVVLSDGEDLPQVEEMATAGLAAVGRE